ncbi:hypothetical protein BKA80DRAFT_283204, partial [Phyllosticta citrichinensis]
MSGSKSVKCRSHGAHEGDGLLSLLLSRTERKYATSQSLLPAIHQLPFTPLARFSPQTHPKLSPNNNLKHITKSKTPISTRPLRSLPARHPRCNHPPSRSTSKTPGACRCRPAPTTSPSSRPQMHCSCAPAIVVASRCLPFSRFASLSRCLWGRFCASRGSML